MEEKKENTLFKMSTRKILYKPSIIPSSHFFLLVTFVGCLCRRVAPKVRSTGAAGAAGRALGAACAPLGRCCVGLARAGRSAWRWFLQLTWVQLAVRSFIEDKKGGAFHTWVLAPFSPPRALSALQLCERREAKARAQQQHAWRS